MSIRIALALIAVTLAASPLVAQEAKSADVPSGPLSEKAQRIANNPMRMVIEASKIQRKAEAAVAASAASAADAKAQPRPAAATGRRKSTPPVASVAPAASPASGSAQNPLDQLRQLERADAARLNAADGVVQSAADAAAMPRLVSRTDPEIPARMMDHYAGRTGEFLIRFTINADGSVSEPLVKTSSLPRIEPYVLNALRQWRYEPMAQARTHQINLVVRLEHWSQTR